MGAASKTVGLAGANPAPEIGRFNRVTGSTWDEETNPKQARATKPSSRITAWERPGGQVNGRVVIEENACSVESRRPREVACGRPGSAPNHPSVVKAVVTWDETDHTHQVSTRRTGHDTLGRSHTVKARTVRWTSRGWLKRRRPVPTRPRSKGLEAKGQREGVGVAEDGGNRSRGKGALGGGGGATPTSRPPVAGEGRGKAG